MPSRPRLILVLGDQLDLQSAAFDGCDPKRDVVWMAEVAAESTKVWNVKARIAVFLASMRHFREALREKGWRVDYHELGKHETLVEALRASVRSLKPSGLVMVQAGEWGVQRDLEAAAAELGVPLEVWDDRHFLCTPAEFAKHAAGRKQLRMEFFYREMRQRTGVLMEKDGPAGGQWNFDHDNRGTFGKEGPDLLRVPPKRFLPDEITREVIALVQERSAKHPGTLKDFDWPVTAAQSLEALDDFITHRLRDFGQYQDAMWTNEPWLYHSRLSAAMNLKMLDPRVVIAAAEKAWRSGKAPLAAVEGFIRQILGWREYVRGIYWLKMPDYVRLNEMQAHEKLPGFYWTGETDMNCLSQAIGQTLRYGYAHHIQRLMVTGLFALLYGVDPHQVHEWYLAVYVDAVEWVELPNTLGMSQYGDGGLMASKPYVASGKYIQRMSNYCTGCKYDPAQSTGPKACPFTTLYWDYLLQHEPRLKKNQRMSMQLKNLARLSMEQRSAIQQQARRVRERCGGEG
ncbi:cryptochrome/photolyase family protein [Prosthecobacter vanneervenii]|uniref:Deoxyribodipyrimidine photolyase-related protein n=1 Tax=Prosthecobacter vanneervenii TaxID=48466 RepID=A0A7W7YFT8_9BACT|nr:cryptochrome/photolyase family protein [Prosthecobacter vanneervenii]MBB5035377.1 deoxyribodipyrimidine photolyase-related protein [Prosthecobacter vanneervenii]